MAAQHRREEALLRELQHLVEFMELELSYRITPLPELAEKTAELAGGKLKRVFRCFEENLNNQLLPDAASCMAVSLEGELPDLVRRMLLLLGQSLGRFDLEGQLQSLRSVKTECGQAVEALAQNREMRLKSYRVLGLSAGAALAILLI